MITSKPRLPSVVSSKRAGDLTRETGAPQPAPQAATAGSPLRRLIVRDVVKTYHSQIGPRRVLDGVSFDVGMGDKIAVLGKNGAGKSTLVKIVGGVETPMQAPSIADCSCHGRSHLPAASTRP